MRVVFYQDWFSFMLDKIVSVFSCNAIELVSKTLTFYTHFLDEIHQFWGYNLQVSHESLITSIGDLPHFLCLIHNIDGLLMLGKYFISIAKHSKTIQLTLMFIFCLNKIEIYLFKGMTGIYFFSHDIQRLFLFFKFFFKNNSSPFWKLTSILSKSIKV